MHEELLVFYTQITHPSILLIRFKLQLKTTNTISGGGGAIPPTQLSLKHVRDRVDTLLRADFLVQF